MDIKIIGDELWFDGHKIATLHRIYPSLDAAIRVHLTRQLTGKFVRGWPSH